MKIKKVTVNLDKGNDKWNEKNSHLIKQTRKDIYKHEEMSKETLQNWKRGKVPKAFVQLFNYLERTGLKISDVLTIKE